jgi:hypothetical protein
LNYRKANADAVGEPGRPDEIWKVFSGFHQQLHEEQ